MNGYKFNNFKVGLSTNSNKNKKLQYHFIWSWITHTAHMRGKLGRWERCSPM